MAKPSALNAKTQRSIFQALNTGASIRAAAESAGIAESTYHSWTARGRKELARIEAAQQALADLPRGTAKTKRDAAKRAVLPIETEKPFVEFVEGATRARASVEVQLINHIVTAAQSGDWRAAAWIMERRGDPEWYKTERHELSGPEGKPIATVNETPNYADPEVRKHAEGLLRARSGRRRPDHSAK